MATQTQTKALWYPNPNAGVRMIFGDNTYGPSDHGTFWASSPILAALADPGRYHLYRQHFTTADSINSTDWTYTEIGAGGTLTHPSGANGGALLTTDALDNDACQIQLVDEVFKLAASKPLWAEFVFKVAKSTQSDVLAGLCITDTTLLAGMTDGVYFRKDDGDQNIDAVCEKNSTETATDTTSDLADDTIVRTQIYANGVTDVQFWINDVLKITTATNIPDDEELTPSFAFINGEAGATTMLCRSVQILQVM